MAGHYATCSCGDMGCPGPCEEREDLEQLDPELESLEASPEGQGWQPDQRDTTPRPPAFLNPRWLRRMQRRIRRFARTGNVDWMEKGTKNA